MTEHIQHIMRDIAGLSAAGDTEKAIALARRHFTESTQGLQLIQSLPLQNSSSDFLRILALALYQSGQAEAAGKILSICSEKQQQDRTATQLYSAAAALQTGDFSKALHLAQQIPAASPAMADARKVADEAVRRQKEQENRSNLLRLYDEPEPGDGKFYVLGMKPIGHDAHVALVDNRGVVVFNAEEERYDRLRHSGHTPLNSLLAGMRQCGIHPRQIRHIAFSFSAPEYEKAARRWERWYRENNRPLHPLKMARVSMGYVQTLRQQEAYFRELFPHADVVHVKHHLAHCAGAFYTSPFECSAVLSLDGRGEFETVMLARGDGHDMEELEIMESPHSLGTLYQTFTYWMGLGARQEGKTMGLSSYGDPQVYYVTFRDRIIDIDEKTGRFTIHPDFIDPDGEFLYDHTQLNAIFGIDFPMDTRKPQQPYADVAAALQRVCEEIFLKMSAWLRELSGEKNLCLTGGVALNSVANGKVLKSGLYEDISIHPAAHDGGTGLGAAMYVLYQNNLINAGEKRARWVMEHPYLGSEFSDTEIQSAIAAAGFPLRKVDDAAFYAAEKLAEGKIVGWFQGRMEVGPRALGNRSILGDPRRAEMKDLINQRVKFRETWRPFAPSVLREECATYFDSDHESPYMLFVYNTLEHMREHIPAVVHVDGTARVQTVTEATNPAYYRLISRFRELTGIGLVLNTSLNVKGEPIVCTPAEAVQCFLVGGMDEMVIGEYVLSREDLPGSALTADLTRQDKRLNIPTRTGRINGFTNIDLPGSPFFSEMQAPFDNLREIQDGSIELIHSHNFLHTLEQDQIRRVLREWARVLMPGGVLIVEVPDAARAPLPDDTRAEMLRRGVHFTLPEQERTALNAARLQAILDETGFVGFTLNEQSPFHPEKHDLLTAQAKRPAPESRVVETEQNEIRTLDFSELRATRSAHAPDKSVQEV